MKYLFIDGNNLIGKTNDLKNLQTEEKQTTREKLVYKLQKGLQNSKLKTTLFFDGFPGTAIRSGKLKIIYSYEKTADDVIKYSIEQHKNPKLIILVTSDLNLREFGKVCSCELKTSEQFAGEIFTDNSPGEESEKIKSIDINDIKKMFGV